MTHRHLLCLALELAAKPRVVCVGGGLRLESFQYFQHESLHLLHGRLERFGLKCQSLESNKIVLNSIRDQLNTGNLEQVGISRFKLTYLISISKTKYTFINIIHYYWYLLQTHHRFTATHGTSFTRTKLRIPVYTIYHYKSNI